VQPLAVGVTVIVAITVDVPVLVAVNEGMLPVPFAARPMEGVLFTHAKVVPDTGLENVTLEVEVPLQ